MPGADLQHAGVTVSDLERTLAFYDDCFGLRAAFVTHLDGPVVEAVTGVEGSSLRIAFVPAGTAFIEFLEYSCPGAPYELRSTDYGASHVAIGVDDIRDAWTRARDAGARVVSGEPLEIQSGDMAQCWYAYLLDPDGLVVELFQPSLAIQALLGS